MSMAQPEKLATPKVVVALQPESVPLDGLVPMAKVIEADEEVTVLPPASWTVTTGWVVKAVPPVAPAGWVEKASLAAAPTVTLKALEVALVSPVDEATTV